MRLLCLSDMHGELRHYESPAHNAHVAVIAGDVTPATHAYYGGKPSGLSLQAHWFAQTFLPWVETLPVEDVLALARSGGITHALVLNALMLFEAQKL